MMNLLFSEPRRLRRALLLLLAACAVSAAFGAEARAAFGPDNKEILSISGTPERALKHGESGILLLGSFFGEGAGIVRLRANGSIDRSFGKDGFAQVPWRDVAVQRDGAILVLASRESPSGYDAILTRLRPNGRPDPSFGQRGTLVVELGGRYDFGTALALTPAGKIVVGGDSGNSLPEGRGAEWEGWPVVARLLPGGALDRSFSGNGRRVIAQMPTIRSLQVERRGAIFAFNRAALLKLRPSGRTDNSFGKRGVVRFDLLRPPPGEEYFEPVRRIGLMPGGKVVVAGTVSRSVGEQLRYRVMAQRLERDGSLDRSYGSNGYAKAGFRGWTFASSLEALKGGRVVVAGNTQVPAKSDSDAAAVVFGSNGRLARDVGRGGKIQVPFPGWVQTKDVVRLRNGQGVLIGYSQRRQGGGPFTILARVRLR